MRLIGLVNLVDCLRARCVLDRLGYGRLTIIVGLALGIWDFRSGVERVDLREGYRSCLDCGFQGYTIKDSGFGICGRQ